MPLGGYRRLRDRLGFGTSRLGFSLLRRVLCLVSVHPFK